MKALTLAAIAMALPIGLFVRADTNKLSQAFSFVTDFVFLRHSLAYTGEQQGLQIIGAGWPRTGTKSIEAALHGLGHRIYDLRSILENQHGDRWLECAKEYKKANVEPCRVMLEELEAAGYTATLDFPMNVFAEVFAELRPQAKVLLSVRDNEQKWVQSWAMINKVLGHFVSRPWKWIIPDFFFAQDILLEMEGFQWRPAKFEDGDFQRPLPWFEILVNNPHLDNEEGQNEWIELHKSFQARLQKTIPNERLLIFNVKEGWEPLVPFLGLEQRYLQEEFPNINDRNSIKIVRGLMDILAIGLPLWVGLILYSLFKGARMVWMTATKTAWKRKML